MKRRRLVKAVLPLIAVLALAGGAWAYFSAAGAGSGGGSASVSVSPVTVAATTGNTQSLLPTGSATGDVKATITNSNGSPVHVSQLLLDTSQGTSGFAGTSGFTGVAGCALGFSTQNNGGNGWTIAANDTLTIDLTSSVTMGTSAANNCQSQTFLVYLKAS